MNKLIEENKNIKKEKEEMKIEINSLNEENRKLKLTLIIYMIDSKISNTTEKSLQNLKI